MHTLVSDKGDTVQWGDDGIFSLGQGPLAFHTEGNAWWSLPHTIHRGQFPVDCRFNCESNTVKLLRENREEPLSGLGVGEVCFLNSTQAAVT